MPRRNRCVLPEIPCHITQRGVDRREVFSADQDRNTYLRLLQENLSDAGVRILGYCLMSNHVHLVAVPAKEDSLSILLRRVHGLALSSDESPREQMNRNTPRRKRFLELSRYFASSHDSATLKQETGNRMMQSQEGEILSGNLTRLFPQREYLYLPRSLPSLAARFCPDCAHRLRARMLASLPPREMWLR